MRLTDLLNLTYVPRWSIVPMLRQQSVGEHTFRTLVIFDELCERLQLMPTANDHRAVLYHDGSESSSADIPGPFKRLLATDVLQHAEDTASPWLTSRPAFSSDTLYRVFRLADRMECYLWLKRWGRGPQARRVELRTRREVDSLIDHLSSVWPMLEERDRMVKPIIQLMHQIDDEEDRFGSAMDYSG